MKKCTKCGATKPLTDYHSRKNTKDRRASWCKLCVNAQNRKTQKKRYAEDSEWREQRSRRAKETRDPEKRRAYDIERNKRRIEDPGYRWQKYSQHTKRKYGLTGEQVEQRLIANKGLCECCGNPIPEPTYKPERGVKSLMHVDHCHETGDVRGLVCHGCNVLLAKVEAKGLGKICMYLVNR